MGDRVAQMNDDLPLLRFVIETRDKRTGSGLHELLGSALRSIGVPVGGPSAL